MVLTLTMLKHKWKQCLQLLWALDDMTDRSTFQDWDRLMVLYRKRLQRLALKYEKQIEKSEPKEKPKKWTKKMADELEAEIKKMLDS